MLASHSIIAALTLVWAASTPPGAATADTQASYKAAIIYNIIRFANFEAAGPSVLNLCVAQGDTMSPALKDLAGKRVGQRQLDVRTVAVPADAAACDIAYVGTDAAFRRALPRTALSIGEAPNFAASGGVGLVRIGRQIRFEINVDAARSAGVSFSSRLLRLATNVRGVD